MANQHWLRKRQENYTNFVYILFTDDAQSGYELWFT